jgi:uncharacterized protein
MKTITQPTPTKDRIEGIDILRGFALMGILLVNILGFNASFFNFGGFYSSLPNAFQQSFYNVYISLTADKFIFLFSFLFGYGIWMQYEKFRDQSQLFRRFFSRRMFLLAVFGLTHVVLLWAGDILIIYAITGFIFLLLYGLRTRWLIPMALFFYFFISVWLLGDVWLDLPNAMSSTCTECLDTAKLIYSDGNYVQVLALRLQEYFAFRNINAFYYLPKVVGIVIMGFVAARNDLYHLIIKNRKSSFGVLVLLTILSIIIYFGYEKIVDFSSPFANALYMFGYEVMNLFIASTYIVLIILLTSFTSVTAFLKPVAMMGRMSLTNYLMQSLIMAVMFYGWGFGLFGQTNIVMLVCIALGIFVLQMIWSVLWFRSKKQGPLEKLWRDYSYR